jgi:micrococcal nuclease
MYLLHEPTTLANGAANIDELIRLIHQYTSNSNCAGGLSAEKVDLEGYTFPGAGRGTEELAKLPVLQPKMNCLLANCNLEKGMRLNYLHVQMAIRPFL